MKSSRAIETQLALVAALGAAIVLAVKCALDLLPRRADFPSWFVPLFVVGILVLAFLATATTIALASRAEPAPLDAARSRSIWLGLLVGVPCTTSVHGFLPFHPALASEWSAAGLVMHVNYVLAFVALGAVLAGAVLDQQGKRELARSVLAVTSLVLFVPNDDCANPFNDSWLALLGASPLMYLPNVFAFGFAAAALRGFSPGRHLILVWLVALTSLALGLGHRTRVIW